MTDNSTNQQKTNETRITMLERDIAQTTLVTSKLESTIERLVDISTSLKQIIAIHEIKLDMKEKEYIQDKKDCNEEIADINAKIDSLQEFRWYASGAIALGIIIVPFVYKFLFR